jgi:hypothetical protein
MIAGIPFVLAGQLKTNTPIDMIADSGYSHEMRRLVCFLFLKQGT